MPDCIFCKIINKEISAEIVYEDEQILAFKDIHPLAPVHILIIPKEHIPTIDDLNEQHQGLAGKMILVAQKIARDLNISENGYKLLFRVKHHGGQEVDHLHLHLIGGAPLAEGIRAIKS
jgi:histidine triad (HIT) family protein